MLLTVTTTHTPATDLGYLLVKHPDRAQRFTVTAGTAHVFYPTATADICTAALLLDLDSTSGEHLDARPYTAGSLMAVAIRTVFGSAMGGRSPGRPELADTPIPLTLRLPTLMATGGAALVERLFAPLGWTVDAAPVPLDPAFPGWGHARHLDTTLTGTLRVADALTHLYVLLPVLDGAKHYRIDADEVDKLLRVGERWLAGHPERTFITRRYLDHRRALVRTALERLAETDDVETFDDALEPPRRESAPLAALRRDAVVAALRDAGAARVLDLGCGGGALLRDLLTDAWFTEIVAADVSSGALDAVERKLRRQSERARARVTVRRSALTYADPALAGYDAAVLMEVIEHVDPERLPALEHAVFGVARPTTVLVTTPNAEYNVRYEGLTGMRHSDHRFEWTRAEFGAWTAAVAERRGYTVEHRPVGPFDDEVGSPTQMGVFTRC